MDTKIQELERQAQAENDGLLAYRVMNEKKRLNLPLDFEPLDTLLRSGVSYGREIKGWEVANDLYEKAYWIIIKSPAKINVSIRGLSLEFEYHKTWKLQPCEGPIVYFQIDSPGMQLLSERVNAFLEQNKEEFLRRSRLVSLENLRNNLAREARLLTTLDDLRREIGENYLGSLGS